MQYFDISEFNCKETGENHMDLAFLLRLDELRRRCGFSFIITSGFRSPTHSIEIVKAIPGVHTRGIAADIKVHSGAEKYTLLQHALNMGFTGIGVADTFIHVDDRTTTPVVWSYK